MSDECTPTTTTVAWQIYEICAPSPAPKPDYPAPSPVEADVLDDKAQKANPYATHCNHEEHCVVKTSDRCAFIAKKLGLDQKIESSAPAETSEVLAALGLVGVRGLPSGSGQPRATPRTR